MKLFELAAPNATKQISQVFESYFGSRIGFENLSARQASGMLKKVQRILDEHRSSPLRHSSEQDPAYLKLIMMEQALVQRIKEQVTAGQTGTMQPGTSGAVVQQTPAQKMASAAATSKQFNDPKVKTALTKAAKGQTLTADEQKLVAGAAMMAQENRLRRGLSVIKESEVQQAQVVLAAQDMVDTMQGMLEDVSELQFKELPALVDSIKNQVGIDQATQFNTDAGAALTALMQSLQQAKQQLDTALGVVTGQTAPAADIPGLAADAGAELGADAGAELGADVEDDLDDVADQAIDDIDDESLGKPALGRARR